MNQWAQRRKRIIFFIVLFLFILLIGLPLFFLFYRAPSCFDGRQNGDEAGVDCGGSCRLLCKSESLPLIARGDPRVLKVADGLYEVVAIVENPNATGVVEKANYTVKIYNKENATPIQIITDVTYIPKGQTFVVFVGPFNMSDSANPSRATLEWDQKDFDWKVDDSGPYQLEVSGVTVSSADARPRIEGVLKNNTLSPVSNVELTVLVSNSSGNAFASSKTFVESIPGGGEERVIFTWPAPFLESASSTRVYIRVLPDQSLIR